jgi:hypothetical protein
MISVSRLQIRRALVRHPCLVHDHYDVGKISITSSLDRDPNIHLRRTVALEQQRLGSIPSTCSTGAGLFA